MASKGKVRIERSQLETGDGTLGNALELWLAQNGPVKYNAFMSLYFGLIRDLKYKDEMAPEAESQRAKQARMKAKYEEIQTNLYGANHVALAVMKELELRRGNGPPGGQEEQTSTALVVYVPEMTSHELALMASEPIGGEAATTSTVGAIAAAGENLRGVAASVPPQLW